MSLFRNILVATDTRLDFHPIVDEAARIAERTGAALTLVDVVPEFPWIARLMVTDIETLRQLVGRNKQEKLDALAAPLRRNGLVVETRVLWGRTSVELIREVLRGRHDLVLRVAKGHNSRAKGFFGATGQRLLRECPCAVWLVADTEAPAYRHVMACLDTSTDGEPDEQMDTAVYELSSLVSRHWQARLSIVHAWRLNAEEFLHSRIESSDFARLLAQRREYVNRRINEFLEAHGSAVNAADIKLLRGEPAEVIPAFANEYNVDLIVMGTAARSGVPGLLIGNTVERILKEVNCSVLAVKPASFISPVSGGEYIDLARQVEHAH